MVRPSPGCVPDRWGVMTASIPFNRPTLVGNELDYIRAAVDGGHSSSKGPFTGRVSDLLKAHLGAAEVLLTTSCTGALEMAAMLLEPKSDDVVIVPSFTFVTTALAFAREGFRLRFADIEPVALGLDPRSVADLIDERVRAIVPVHYAGVGCEVESILDLAARHGIRVIEDNAHGLFGSLNSRPLGSFGDMSTLSFHETKNFVCGEGGALVINDPDLIDRAHVLLDKGTNRRSYEQGVVDKYTWCDHGSSFGMSDLLAAFLLAQLERKERVLCSRREATERYDRLLRGVVDQFGVEFAQVPRGRQSAFHMYYLLMPSKRVRDSVLTSMHQDGVMSTFHYVPLHRSPGAVRHLDGLVPDLPVTDDISGRLLRLPYYTGIDEVSQVAVVESLLRALQR